MHKLVARFSWLAFPLVTACGTSAVGDDTSGNDEVATVTQPIENLDRTTGPATTSELDPHELRMTAGRLNKVPASPAWHGKFSYYIAGTGTRRIHIRANCTSSTAPRDLCDPAMFIVQKTVTGKFQTISAVLYENDSSTQTSTPFSAYRTIDYEAYTIPQDFEVIVYSHGRGTAQVNVQWDDTPVGSLPDWDSGHTFSNGTGAGALSGINQTVGGTLVKVGTTAAGETLSVRTAQDGADEFGLNGTRMWLFNPNRKRFAFVNGATSGDRDPSYTFPTGWTWSQTAGGSPQTYALVATDFASTGAHDKEQFVQLVKSSAATEQMVDFSWPSCQNPLNAGILNRPSCLESGWGETLAPGTYHLSVFAKTLFPVGESPDSEGDRRFAQDIGDSTACGENQGYPERGQGNDMAFQLEVLRDGAVIGRRAVPRAVLGSSGGAADGFWNRVTYEVTVPDDGWAHSYQINLRDLGARVVVRDQWSYRRDPEEISLKVTTANIEYHGIRQTDPELKNAVGLLGAGPTFVSNSLATRYRRNRGYWRFEADILNFNEILPYNNEIMSAELNSRTNLSWNVLAKESAANSLFSNRDSVLLLNRLATPKNTQLRFSDEAMDNAHPDCTSDQGDGIYRCHVADAFGRSYYMVPARAAARATKQLAGSSSANAYDETPIALFSVYYPHDDDELGERRDATNATIEHMRGLLREQPEAFNRSATNAPLDPGNRMIILGDMNMKNHQCSEVNDFLRRLRDEFGYAVDVSMAATDALDRTFDMHYSGAPLTSWFTGSYFYCLPDVAENGDYESVGRACPYHFRHTDVWADLPSSEKFAVGTSQWHAWWAGPGTAGGGSSSRLDVVILAGLGWADDDPVREYNVLTNKESVPNPMNGNDNAAINVSVNCGDGLVTGADPDSYAPEHTVGSLFDPCPDGGTSSGALVYRSNHKPVGTRLRTLLGR